MEIFISLLPLIVLLSGLIICIISSLIMDKVLYLEAKTTLMVVCIILILTLVSCAVASKYQNICYFEKVENLVQNGYSVYINGSAVDFNKIVISDYSVDKIHINDELKEIYIQE